ncbi:unnamed protein product, partial [Candidula unifasciata]
DLEEDFWDIDDSIDEDDDDDGSYKWERDRFDTAELNSFLKKKLLPDNPDDVKAEDTPSEKEPEPLKVEPKGTEEAEEHILKEVKNVEKQEVSAEIENNKDENKSDREETIIVDAPDISDGEESNTVDTPKISNGEESNLVDAPMISNGEESNTVDDPSNNTKSDSDEIADEGKEVEVSNDEKESRKEETVEDTHVDLEVDDPTELDESSPDEFEMKKMEDGKSENLKEAAESNGKQESKTVVEETSATDLHFKGEGDANSDDEEELKSKHSPGTDSKGTHEINMVEEAVSKDLSKDASSEADLKHLKEELKSSDTKNIEDKNEAGDTVLPTGDKSADETHFDKTSTAEHETDGSDVTPDTLLDASSPEFNQRLDSLALEKSRLVSDVEGRGHPLENTASIEADKSSEDISSLSDEGEGKSKKENSVSESFTAEHVDQGDEKYLGDSFLHSSRAQLEDSDLAKETPKLDINPTSASISEKISESQSSQVGIESSNTDDQKIDATGNQIDKKLAKTEELETITEGGSTIVINKEGELVTAILPEGHISQTSDEVALTSSSGVASSLLTNSGQLDPTAVGSILKPSQTLEELKKLDTESQQKAGNNFNHKSANTSGVQQENSDILLDSQLVNKDYQSADFNSRKVLSVDHTAAAASQQQQQPQQPASEQPSEEQKQQNLRSVVPTPVASPPSKLDSEMSLAVSETLAETLGATSEDADNQESSTDKEHSSANGSDGPVKQELLPDQLEQPDGAPKVTEAATEIPTGHTDLPPSENSVESAQTPEDTSSATDYATDSIYHSRKINDEDLMNEEEQKFTGPSQGFFKKIIISIESQSKNLLEKLPPSVHSVLESFGLVSNMKLVVITFAVALLISMTFISCCSSGGSNKKLQQQMLVKFDELEKKRLIDIKERQNLEDEISSKEAKNQQMKGEIEKLKEEAKKNKSELQTVQLHNETLKKQLTSFQSQLEELKENASSKQGEVKQQSKKTKDLEKQIKKLEERERNFEQTAQKLLSDLKHKEEEVVLLTSKVVGFTDLVGHLQTSKDQLLAEADDWREKVSDLKERLEQREEEFREMQETIMFKENELEVLKDCFLQLKAFEEREEGEEDAENVSARVQEKIASMMDVSKMNASLIALEEEKNSLTNKLQIELEARRELEEQLESSRRSLETSMADKMKAERQYQEAQTKFNVLSSYFKEKEMQLQRELGEHEALKKQNLNKLVNADETTKSIQQELDFIRTQNESLKRELASSERDFRSQIAANEKKAHENWLAARAAERELKEARHEAGVLRQKLTDIERRQFIGPGGLIRPLPTRLPPTGILNGPPPGMERSPSRGSLPPMLPIPPPHLRDEDFIATRGDRGPPLFPLDMRRGPLPPPGMRPPLDARSPPPRLPPFGSAHSPPLRMPPPGMMDGRSPPPYDRRLPPHHMSDRRSPPFRLPPPDMFPPPPPLMRGGPLPHHYLSRGGAGSPPLGPDSPHLDGRYPLPSYGRNPPHPQTDRHRNRASRCPHNKAKSNEEVKISCSLYRCALKTNYDF